METQTEKEHGSIRKDRKMGRNWRTAIREMQELTNSFNTQRKEPIKCVHKSLTLRALSILKQVEPGAEKFFAPMERSMVIYSKRPDKKGDYEKGMGRHYYCAVSPTGKPNSPINGYYKNGIGQLYNSARALLEENYTMALTMYLAGYTEQSAKQLGRAIHMISDICCLPHASGMTYYSSRRKMHKAYENFAEAMYPEFIPEQSVTELDKLFKDRSSFGAEINSIAELTGGEMGLLEEDPKKEVVQRLMFTERTVASLMQRFMEDTQLPEKEAHYITNGSGARLLPDTAHLTVKVTEKGIVFHGVNPSPESKVNVTDGVFYAAHRHDGLFTISPARSRNGQVLEVVNGKICLRKFNPIHGEQLFRL